MGMKLTSRYPAAVMGWGRKLWRTIYHVHCFVGAHDRKIPIRVPHQNTLYGSP